MDRAEVGEVPVEVELLGDNCEAGGLREVEAPAALQVARVEQVLALAPQVGHALGGAPEVGLVLQVDPLGPGLQVALDLRPERLQRPLQLLLEELEQQVAGQQHLVVRQRVGVVLAALAVGQRVELEQHGEREAQLVPRLPQVDEEEGGEEVVADLVVSLAGGEVERDAKQAPKVLHALHARVQPKARSLAQQQLGARGDKGGVGRAGAAGGAGHQAGEDLSVARLQKALEQDAGGDEVLRAADGEREHGGAVGQVVAAVGEARLVGAHAAHERGQVGERGAALVVGAAAQRHNVVPPVLHQHADDALNAIAYEVAPKLVGLLLGLDQLLAGGAAQVAGLALDHDRHHAHAPRDALRLADALHLAHQVYREGGIVGGARLPAVARQQDVPPRRDRRHVVPHRPPHRRVLKPEAVALLGDRVLYLDALQPLHHPQHPLP